MGKSVKTINNSAIVSLLMQKRNLRVEPYKGQVVGQVYMQTANLQFHSRAENYRPYLALSGRVEKLLGDFPQGVTELKFDVADQPKFIGVYDFAQDELQELVGKGLYTSTFEVPDELTDQNTYFEIDMDAEVSVVTSLEDDVPVVLANVIDINNMVLTRDNTGYNLAEYFGKQSEATYKNEFSKFIKTPEVEVDLGLSVDEEAKEVKPLGLAKEEAAFTDEFVAESNLVNGTPKFEKESKEIIFGEEKKPENEETEADREAKAEVDRFDSIFANMLAGVRSSKQEFEEKQKVERVVQHVETVEKEDKKNEVKQLVSEVRTDSVERDYV